MKQWIKIIILFVLVTIILIGGLYMYSSLEYNKQSFSTSIYNHIPVQTLSVININKEYNIDNLLFFDSSLIELTNIITASEVSYPVVLCKSEEEETAIIARTNKEQEAEIKEYIEEYIAESFYPKIKKYKDEQILIYSLPNNNFLACSFYKGIFAACKNYKQIENIIDTDVENNFFTNEEYEEEISKTLCGQNISVFFKHQHHLLALDYNMQNDTIKMEGYILPDNRGKSGYLDYKTLLYSIQLPENICIDYSDVLPKNNPPIVKIILNKIY